MRKWLMAFASLILLMTTGVAMLNGQKASAAVADTATSTATVEFTSGVSLLAAPNFDFGVNKINPMDTTFDLVSDQDDSTYGRSLVVKNDGGYEGWTVSAQYDTDNGSFTYENSDKIADSQMNWNDVQIQELQSDGTWKDISGYGTITAQTIKQGISTSVFSTDSSEVGTYRLNFPNKNSASLNVPGESQKVGTATTDMTWTLVAGPTS
ncbi:WxL domain-containing protein [Agrilactobacillus yilanensis]|uniref:WxL domain-containing protein n=1 Tax=Agrilactobacillus yilanensis TaxID=2485997 RepID=A0ABW4J898_9LACO|nr:WxL domain-containing protein [Agrilactobacillus yilanensis]